MNTSSLASLRIENLRGAVSPLILNFEKGRKLTIIYGENGTGKSTISDALDLLGNGCVGSLEGRGVGSTRSYWPSVGKAHADVKVMLSTSAGACTLSLGKKEVVFDDENLKPQVDVLRHSQILNLITAQPAKRYEAIRKFVDVSGVENSEAALRKLILDKKKAYETATTRFEDAKTSINNFWQQMGSPDVDASTWAKAEAQKDLQELDQKRAVIDSLILIWDKVVSHPDRLAKLNQQLDLAKKDLETAKANLAAITSDVADDYLEVLNILKAAQEHFSRHPHPTVCPLCESSEKAEDLVAKVTRRIELQGVHAKLDAAKNMVKTQERNVQSAEQRIEDYKKDAVNDFLSLENCCEITQVIPGLDIPDFPIPDAASQWQEWIDIHKAKRDDWKQAADACIDSKNFVQTLKRALDDYEEAEAAARELEAVLPRLDAILKIVESERKKYTDDILAAISTRVGELYEAIHPGEGLNKIVLALEAGKRGSLDITADFAQKTDVPPQAYFSDSHLDTLGLCVFLALAEREAPEKKILVLDDVLGSVDEPHVERVIEMIYDVSQKFQHAIVTTHYRPWREKFRWGILNPGKFCQFVELRQWSFDDGIALTGCIPETDRLKKLLADPDPDIQSIAGKAGVILEAILDFLTLKYNCAVPRNQGNAYTLNELLNSINRKLLDTLTVELVEKNKIITSEPIKPMLDEIRDIAQTRNVMGAHFNRISFELHPDDGIRFARQVERLCDVLICPNYGWPTKDTGSYWKNGGDTRRLHPLKKPS